MYVNTWHGIRLCQSHIVFHWVQCPKNVNFVLLEFLLTWTQTKPLKIIKDCGIVIILFYSAHFVVLEYGGLIVIFNKFGGMGDITLFSLLESNAFLPKQQSKLVLQMEASFSCNISPKIGVLPQNSAQIYGL